MFPSPQSSQMKPTLCPPSQLTEHPSLHLGTAPNPAHREYLSPISCLPQDLFTCILRESCTGLAHSPKYPEARQFPLPTGICLLSVAFLPTLGDLCLLRSFSILVNGRRAVLYLLADLLFSFTPTSAPGGFASQRQGHN